MSSDRPGDDVQGIKVYSFIARLVENGATPAEIRERLIEAGVGLHNADRLTERLAHAQLKEKLRTQAATLLACGIAPDQLLPMLMEKGFPQQMAAEQVANLVTEQIADDKQARESPSRQWRMMGGILLVVGLVLFIGNRSGLFPTFPFSGGLTMFVGAIALLMGWFNDQPEN